TGTDANGITAWFLKENSSTPSLGDSGWVSSAPSSFTVSTSYGLHTISIWARDAAGNISDPATISMTLWPTPAATLQGGTERVGHEPIQLRFNASMNTGSVTVTGDLSACDKQWTTTTLLNDTFTLRPSTGALWPSGTGKTLIVNGASGVGITMTTFNASFTVRYRIYVNAVGGNDSDPDAGSTSVPFASPNPAISLAASRYRPSNPVEIWVAQGLYAADYSLPAHPTAMDVSSAADGAAIMGGYKVDNWSVRDPATYASTLRDSSTDGGAGALTDANRAVHFGTGVTSATVLDGFVIEAAASTTASSRCVGILCEGASPTIRACAITGGLAPTINCVGILCLSSSAPEITACQINGGTGQWTYGIDNRSSAPHISNNTILAGSGTSYSRGIYCNASAPLITGNWIQAGTNAQEAAGIHLASSSAAMIYNNTISGGKGGNGTTFYTAQGIYASSSNPDIRNNSIDGGSVQDSGQDPHPRCIYLWGGSLPIIENNILFVRDVTVGYGIYEADTTSDPVSIKNNDFFDCGDAFYFDENVSPLTTIGGVNALTGASANVTTNAQFVNKDGYDWHLTASTPTAVSQGGLALSGVASFPQNAGGSKIDKDGVVRTPSSGTGWSIGAYERD
ncbi:MAG: right-handed parallel beta-helix repeat-containing protein, partial [Spirochaetes bacterium]|nr:right-handed parallel beta-helix repeat-containing protein [Spirochaetota bacterium]